MQFPQFTLQLPQWMGEFLNKPEYVLPTPEDRMDLVIALARENITRSDSGPFGAAVFETGTGRLVAPGVNMVLGSSCSIAHAEIVALSMAHQVLGHFDLGDEGFPDCELVTSTEPCTMCMGAVLWSGVKRLVCGARDEDAREIGFDEGPKPPEWVRDFEDRGIAVLRDVRRAQARTVLRQYKEDGGIIYNSRGHHRG